MDDIERRLKDIDERKARWQETRHEHSWVFQGGAVTDSGNDYRDYSCQNCSERWRAWGTESPPKEACLGLSEWELSLSGHWTALVESVAREYSVPPETALAIWRALKDF